MEHSCKKFVIRGNHADDEHPEGDEAQLDQLIEAVNLAHDAQIPVVKDLQPASCANFLQLELRN
jgi:hypothetical protein